MNNMPVWLDFADIRARDIPLSVQMQAIVALRALDARILAVDAPEAPERCITLALRGHDRVRVGPPKPEAKTFDQTYRVDVHLPITEVTLSTGHQYLAFESVDYFKGRGRPRQA